MANLKDLIVNGAARIIGKVYASEFVGNLSGNAETATKLGISDVGDTTTPMYLSAGMPKVGTALAAVATSGSYDDLSNKPPVYSIRTEGDNRDSGTTPNDYVSTFKFSGLKSKGVINFPSDDDYSYLLGLRGWNDYSGGNSWELAFNNTGIFARTGATTSWGDWKKVWVSGDALTDSNGNPYVTSNTFAETIGNINSALDTINGEVV